MCPVFRNLIIWPEIQCISIMKSFSPPGNSLPWAVRTCIYWPQLIQIMIIWLGSQMAIHKETNVLKKLCVNNEILILPPDKCFDVVVLNRRDYVEKLFTMLSDKMKFKRNFLQQNVANKFRSQFNKNIVWTVTTGRYRLSDTTTLSLNVPISSRLYGVP